MVVLTDTNVSIAHPGDARRSSSARCTPSIEVEGLRLGCLAADLRTSKGGIQSLLGTKQELQLLIAPAASQVFEREVSLPAARLPAARLPAGTARLRALTSLWIDYRETFEGGYFSLLPQMNSTARCSAELSRQQPRVRGQEPQPAGQE
ncbi:hypothetical protein GCM10009789_39050 [Kribbella sancticallisti]|uniref:Uncharacterized protein n=1 Tax=Kribbella sancticallisti TaxID=460087 RepID=A0ABN2DR03_9ACTN